MARYARYATAEERAEIQRQQKEAEQRYHNGESTWAEWQRQRGAGRPVATEVWALLSERGLGYKQGQEAPTNADIWAAYDELGLEWTWVESKIEMSPAEAREIEAIEDTTEDTEMEETTETTEEEVREWSMLEADIDTETVANTILEWRDGYRCEQEEVPAHIELWAIRHSRGYLTQAQKWEQDPNTADAWSKVWQTIRAGRIGGLTPDWAHTDDAWLLASEFANEVLGIEDGEPTAEWEDLVDQCLAEIGRLL